MALSCPSSRIEEAMRFRVLSPEEIARMLSAAATVPHLMRFCMIALNTLARPDAIFDLRPSQVDLTDRIMHLNPSGRIQTKKYRPVVPISDTLLPWLKDCEGPTYVSYFGKPIRSIKKSFAEAAKLAGVDNVTPYCLRTTMATELRRRNVSEWELMGIMGHKSKTARTTERYAFYSPDYLSAAIKAIDAYFLDLKNEFSNLVSGPVFNQVRASSVLVEKPGSPQGIEKMVGAVGIEPTTPTMSPLAANPQIVGI